MNNSNKDLESQIDVRHFQLTDLDSLAKALNKNADHIADYLVDGKPIDRVLVACFPDKD